MITATLRFICRLIFRVQVTGFENLPIEKKLLIIANHESFLDGLLLGLFLPIPATFVVHSNVLNSWIFRQILRLTPYLAVDPSSPLAMKKVIKLLEAGKPVVIFPEGRITLTGSLMKVYDGPGFVAAKWSYQRSIFCKCCLPYALTHFLDTLQIFFYQHKHPQ